MSFRVRELHSLPEQWSAGQSQYSFTVATMKPGKKVCPWLAHSIHIYTHIGDQA